MYLTIPLLALLTLSSALPHDESPPAVIVFTETIFITITQTGDDLPTSSSPSDMKSPPVSNFTTTMTSSCTHFSHTHTGLTGTQGVAAARSSYASSVHSEAMASEQHDTTTASSSELLDSTTASVPVYDPVGWGGIDDALFTSVSIPQNLPRHATTTSQARPWRRFFVGAMTMPHSPGLEQNHGTDEGEGEGNEGCISCPKGRDIVCINATHFGYCDEGCVEPRRVREGMRCLDGRMYGNRNR